MEKQAQIDGIPELADMLGTKPEYITPITPEEYAENADGGREVRCKVLVFL